MADDFSVVKSPKAKSAIWEHFGLRQLEGVNVHFVDMIYLTSHTRPFFVNYVVHCFLFKLYCLVIKVVSFIAVFSSAEHEVLSMSY